MRTACSKPKISRTIELSLPSSVDYFSLFACWGDVYIYQFVILCKSKFYLLWSLIEWRIVAVLIRDSLWIAHLSGCQHWFQYQMSNIGNLIFLLLRNSVVYFQSRRKKDMAMFQPSVRAQSQNLVEFKAGRTAFIVHFRLSIQFHHCFRQDEYADQQYGSSRHSQRPSVHLSSWWQSDAFLLERSDHWQCGRSKTTFILVFSKILSWLFRIWLFFLMMLNSFV